MSKKVFRPSDMDKLVYPSDISISADGTRGAWVESKSKEDLTSFESKIYIVNLDGFSTISLTVPEGENPKYPRLLRDGLHLLYLGDRTGTYQIYLRDLESGEDIKLTSARHGVKRFSLSKDEGTIAFETTLWQEEIDKGLEFKEMDSAEEKTWNAQLDLRPYEIEDIMYKRNEWFGMRKGEKQYCALTDIGGKKQKLLDFGDMETEFPALSSNGKKVYCYGYPYGGVKGRTFELFEFDVQSGIYKQLTFDGALYGEDFPAIAGDGSVIVPAIYEFEDGGMSIEAYKVDCETGKGCFMRKDEDEKVCHGIFEVCASHTAYGNHREAVIVGDNYYFLNAFKGRGNLCRKNVPAEGASEVYVKSDGHIQSFDVAEDGSVLYTQGTLNAPAEVYYRKAIGECPAKLSNSNSWLDEYNIAKTEEFWIKSGDGKADIQVWLTHPVNEEAGRKYPAVLNIHGGPTCSVNADFWHEVQALANAGNAVIMTNPRGSLGYGHEFCQGPIAWKWEAMQDLLDAVDACIAKGFIDEKRVGITGGSYGGYSTNKLIGRTDKFAAAVTQRCLVNPGTSYGTGDMGYKSASPEDAKMTMLEYLEDRVRGNLITYVDNIKIPLLILHGYKDYRCSFEQAEQIFVAMRDRNPEVPCRLVMFPTENHDLTRSGKPSNQIRHLQEMTDWFVKYLGEEKHE